MGKYIWFDKIVLSLYGWIVLNKKAVPNNRNGFFKQKKIL